MPALLLPLSLPLILPLSVLLSACQGEAPREQEQQGKEEEAYGEPVGLQMAASEALPAFEIALAVSKGAEVEPLVAPLGGLIHGAIKGCPGFVSASAGGEVTQLALTIEQGKIAEAAAAGEHPDPCLSASLRGKALAPAPAGTPPRLRAIAQIRFAKVEPGEAP